MFAFKLLLSENVTHIYVEPFAEPGCLLRGWVIAPRTSLWDGITYPHVECPLWAHSSTYILGEIEMVNY